MTASFKTFSNVRRALLVFLLGTALSACSGGSSGVNGDGASAAQASDPVTQQPSQEAPAPEEPVAEEPAQEEPAQEEPAPEEPAQEAPAPSVNFSAQDDVVESGAGTTLSWSSTNADSCTAGGAWSGGKPTQGSEAVGPLDQETTFSLSCSGPGGSAVSMLSVAVMGSVTLSWQAPAENVDGSPLTDLAGYRIYWGETSGVYPNSIDVTEPQITSQTISLASGDYYFVMTALDAEGNESAYSNEVIKTVN